MLGVCFYCHSPIQLRDLPGFGEYWLKIGVTYEGSAVCSARDDDGHSPDEEHDDDPA